MDNSEKPDKPVLASAMPRRDFLKLGGAAGAAAPARLRDRRFPQCRFPAQVLGRSRPDVRAGAIGCSALNRRWCAAAEPRVASRAGASRVLPSPLR